MEKKYKLLSDSIRITEDGTTLYRIKAIRDFGGVKEGDLGGYIEKEDNLSHEGNCWVGDVAKVYGNAQVINNAKVYGSAKVYGDTEISDNARVNNSARVYGNAHIYGYAHVYEDTFIYGSAVIRGNARIFGRAQVHGKAIVDDTATISDNANVYGDAKIYNNSAVYGDAVVYHKGKVCENGQAFGSAVISSKIIGKVHIKTKKVESFKSDSSRLVTVLTLPDDSIVFNVGCAIGMTKEEFINKIHNDTGGLERNPHRKFYLKILEWY